MSEGTGRRWASGKRGRWHLLLLGAVVWTLLAGALFDRTLTGGGPASGWSGGAPVGVLWLVGLALFILFSRRFAAGGDGRDESEDELRRAQELLEQERELFDTGSVLVFLWRNAEGWPVEHASESVADMLGYTADDLLSGRVPYATLVHPDDLARVGEEVARFSAERVPRFQREPYRLLDRHGEEHWVLDNTTVRYDRDGQITHYQGYLVDITDLHSATEALRASEERLALVFDATDLGMWDWNIVTGHVVFSERWCDMLGYGQNEVRPHKDGWKALLHPDDLERVSSVLQEHLDGHTPLYECEQRLRAKSGQWHWILAVGRVSERDAEGRPLRALGIHLDIMERKELEQKLVRQERLAAVGQLSAGIAHDFNNLLTTMMGTAELMKESGAVPPADRKHLDTILTATSRAACLVRQMLDFSQKTVRRPETLDLAGLVDESLPLLRTGTPDSIRIDWQAEGEALWLRADPTQLQQVITNLVVNARYAMPEGGTLRLRASRGTQPRALPCEVCGLVLSGEWVRLEIADTGHGIPADRLPHIFEPFFTTREAGVGSGLGLSQVAGIVAQHGGHVTVESRPGEGSTFTVYLPPSPPPPPPATGAVSVSGAAPVSEAVPVSVPPAAPSGQRVLLVEDEPHVLRVLERMLRVLGYEVLTAASGEEALAIYRSRDAEIALVLSDMAMPDLDGVRLFDVLRQEDPELRMVLMSGHPLGELGAQLREKGLRGWRQKPLSLDDVSQLVAEALG